MQAQQPGQPGARGVGDDAAGFRAGAGLRFEQHALGLKHPQRLADRGPADAEHRGQVALGWQPVADGEAAGAYLLFDAVEDQLVGARPGQRLPRR